MKNRKNRLEFLLPNITSERKLKWLANTELEWRAADYDITQYTFEQYLEKMITDDDIKCVDQDNHDCTKEYHYRYYMDLFFSGKEKRMCQLEEDNVKWDNDKIDLLATYLSSHPLLIPHFLQDNAINIVGGFFGECFVSTLGFSENRHIREKSKREHVYKCANIIAKYRLSLFIATIKKMLELGVNISEYEFQNLEDNNTFAKMEGTSKWNQKIIDGISEEGYQRIDGQHFSKEQMLNFLDFNNILGFLNRIIALTEVEYNVCFIEEAKMLNPNNIIPLKKHCNGIKLLNTNGEMVNVSTVCQELIQEMKQVQVEAEYKVLERKMVELANIIKDYTTEEDLKIKILPRIDAFYELLDDCNQDPEVKDIWLNALEDFLIENNLKEKVSKTANNKQEQFKEKLQNVEEKLALLTERMTNIEKKLDSLEKELTNYIEHGGVNPLSKGVNISEQELTKILENITPKTLGGRVRKMQLITWLKGGLAGFLLGTILTTTEIQPTTPEEPAPHTLETITENPPEFIQRPISLYELMERMPIDRKDLTEEELESIALEVIRGNFGNGEEREEKLTENGYDYDYIQSLVNEAYQKNQIKGIVLKK